jgi:hypothetical protein
VKAGSAEGGEEGTVAGTGFWSRFQRRQRLRGEDLGGKKWS